MKPLEMFALVYHGNDREQWYRLYTLRGERWHYNDLSIGLARRLALRALRAVRRGRSSGAVLWPDIPRGTRLEAASYLTDQSGEFTLITGATL